MGVKGIVAELENQIARLKEARALLAGEGTGRRKRGRPRGSTNVVRRGGFRRLTPEGRKRISEALKRRWALRRKAVARGAK